MPIKNIEKCMEIVNEDADVFAACGRVTYFPLVIKKGYGAIIEDMDGNEYIDLLASAAALNTGHSHPKIVSAIVEQAKEFIHYTPGYMYHESIVELSKALIEITPGYFKKKIVYGLSGSDANDGMIKLARAYTRRSKIISFIPSYHGSTYGAMSLTSINLNMRRLIGPMLPDIYHFQYPDCYRCSFEKCPESCSLECLESLENAFRCYLPADEVAAIVMEPIAGDGGILVPPEKYMKRIFEICRQNKILFAVDEVQQGFGRTGKWFGIDNFGIVPDIVVMGKSIASGMPLSAISAREEIVDSLSSPAHIFTTSGNPISCRAAIATIDVIKEENLLNHAVWLGEYAKECFSNMKDKYELIGDVRGIGLSIGIELVKDRNTKEKATEAAMKICYRCWEKGLILIYFAGSVLRIQPPLVISKKQLDKAIEIIEETINEYVNGKISDKALEVIKGW